MRYYIADTHFFHGALNHQMDMRGFQSVEAMNDYMITKWNGKVRSNDEVVILGDFSWGSAEDTNQLLNALNGRLYLIQGNHDRFLKNKHYDTSRFLWIKPYAEVSDKRRKVVLCHYPIICYNGQYRTDDKGVPKTYMLYGHVHDTQDERLIRQFQQITGQTVVKTAEEGARTIPCQMINCFCKYSDYEPLTLNEWILNDRERRGIKD